MSTHVRFITSKLTQRLYFLKQLRRAGVLQNNLFHFYTCGIRPVLEYAIPVWNQLLTKTQIDEISGSFTATLTTCLALTYYIVLTFSTSQTPTVENSSHASS